MFEIEFKRYGTVVLATVYSTQVIDAASVSSFGDQIIAFLEDHKDSHILLNFTKVDYMSSGMLTELLRINDVVRRQRGSMRICGLRKEVKQLFAITKLDALFHIENDCKACLKQFHDDVKSQRHAAGES